MAVDVVEGILDAPATVAHILTRREATMFRGYRGPTRPHVGERRQQLRCCADVLRGERDCANCDGGGRTWASAGDVAPGRKEQVEGTLGQTTWEGALWLECETAHCTRR